MLEDGDLYITGSGGLLAEGTLDDPVASKVERAWLTGIQRSTPAPGLRLDRAWCGSVRSLPELVVGRVLAVKDVDTGAERVAVTAASELWTFGRPDSL